MYLRLKKKKNEIPLLLVTPFTLLEYSPIAHQSPTHTIFLQLCVYERDIRVTNARVP